MRFNDQSVFFLALLAPGRWLPFYFLRFHAALIVLDLCYKTKKVHLEHFTSTLGDSKMCADFSLFLLAKKA